MAQRALDASAVPAWLQNEAGTVAVDPYIGTGAIASVNWSEVLQKVEQKGRDPHRVAALLKAMGLQVMPALEEDAVMAATFWRPAPNLSLADRCCLAFAHRLGIPAMTADRAWAGPALGVQVILIR